MPVWFCVSLSKNTSNAASFSAGKKPAGGHGKKPKRGTTWEGIPYAEAVKLIKTGIDSRADVQPIREN